MPQCSCNNRPKPTIPVNSWKTFVQNSLRSKASHGSGSCKRVSRPVSVSLKHRVSDYRRHILRATHETLRKTVRPPGEAPGPRTLRERQETLLAFACFVSVGKAHLLCPVEQLSPTALLTARVPAYRDPSFSFLTDCGSSYRWRRPNGSSRSAAVVCWRVSLRVKGEMREGNACETLRFHRKPVDDHGKLDPEEWKEAFRGEGSCGKGRALRSATPCAVATSKNEGYLEAKREFGSMSLERAQ